MSNVVLRKRYNQHGLAKKISVGHVIIFYTSISTKKKKEEKKLFRVNPKET